MCIILMLEQKKQASAVCVIYDHVLPIHLYRSGIPLCPSVSWVYGNIDVFESET